MIEIKNKIKHLFKKASEAGFIQLFPIYRFAYNLQGHILHLFGYWGDKFHIIPWYDPPIWHKHPDHPCHKPWVRDMVRYIYFSTGMVPLPEYQHLLEQEK